MSIKGENSILYIWDTSAYKPVACLTSNSLNSTLSVIESTTKCFPGVVKKTAGQFNYTIDAEGEYIDTTSVGGDTAKISHDALLALQMAKTLVTWKLDTDVTDATSVKYYGDAYITDLGNTAGSGDEVSTFSATLSGDGAIVLTDPNESLLPEITSSSTINIIDGTSGTFNVVATNTPTTYGFTGSDSPPLNVSINSSTGVISWTDDVPLGTYPVQIVVANSEGSDTQNATINVTAP